MSAYCKVRYRENQEEIRAKAKEAYKGKKDKVQAINAIWRSNNQDKVKAARKKRYQENRELAVAATMVYYEANKDKVKARAAKWAKDNPAKVKVYGRNRKARERLAEGSHTAADIARIMIAQKCKCALCRKSIKKKNHVDHITPLVLGGSNWPCNLQLLCPTCNLSKNARDPIDFSRSLGMLL